MYDNNFATQFAMAILLAMTGLAVGLLFHSSPAALFFAIGLAVAAVLVCPSPP
jgi:hypothetical protein